MLKDQELRFSPGQTTDALIKRQEVKHFKKNLDTAEKADLLKQIIRV